MFFYEIHEGDDELGTGVLLMHESRFEPTEFCALVKKARALVKDSCEEDSLAEAIATELERSSGFTHITDERLVGSVCVDESDEGTYLVHADEGTRSVRLSRDEEDRRN
jgi:hypothetical protein